MAGSKEEIPHLNCSTSPNWILPFSVGVMFAVMGLFFVENAFALPGTERSSIRDIVSILLASFSLVLFTSFWVAIRGTGRQFCSAMKYVVLVIGIVGPVVVVGLSLFLEYIGYGKPTLASPGLEAMLISSILNGEAVVQFASSRVNSLLG